jgi:hypothetical protein
VQWRHRDHPFLPRIDVVRPERIPRESIVTLDGVFGIRRPGGRIVMDKVQPAEPWRPGFDNIFDWPTRDVIHQLGKINMYDLGVVARLGNTDPSVAERVAPVIFYHSQVPANVLGYVFTFKTNGHARLTCEVYDEASVKPVFTHHIHRQPGGTAFTVRWDSSQAAEGSYRLVVRGFFLENNRRINQTVSFYHQPAVR